jgi:hypothetical protein
MFPVFVKLIQGVDKLVRTLSGLARHRERSLELKQVNMKKGSKRGEGVWLGVF